MYYKNCHYSTLLCSDSTRSLNNYYSTYKNNYQINICNFNEVYWEITINFYFNHVWIDYSSITSIIVWEWYSASYEEWRAVLHSVLKDCSFWCVGVMKSGGCTDFGGGFFSGLFGIESKSIWNTIAAMKIIIPPGSLIYWHIRSASSFNKTYSDYILACTLKILEAKIINLYFVTNIFW